ncbi:MAG: ParB N-terminal domain-containing protein [Gemmataceae bacterium]|nr:ParB N-terminal domain-containing protein [Gemmataceae bacterium]
MHPHDFELRTMPLPQLIPAPYNPRRPLSPQSPAYRRLERSLREFGLVEPLIWNETTGHVVGGHLRLSILKKLGVTEVPVSVVRLSPEREKALNIILNNREAQGRFDPDSLRSVLEDLHGLPEFDLTGFDSADLKSLRLEPVTELAPLPPPDQLELIVEVPRESYETIQSRLDELVREFDLVCHVRGL